MPARMNQEEPKPTPLWCSARLALSLVGFLGFANLYGLQVNLSIAMVCMVNHTYVASLRSAAAGADHPGPGKFLVSRGRSSSSCDVNDGTANGTGSSGMKDGEFKWSKEVQGLILGSFFWGYLLTQLPGGWLASRYGGKRVLGYCLCACSVLTLLMPLAARADYRLLMITRVLAGICQGVVWPAMSFLWGGWAPPLEMGKLAGFCYAGAQIGNVVTFPVAAWLCEHGFDGGWPSIFYVLGVSGLLWFALWTIFAFDSPATHPRISTEEKLYIQSCLKGRAAAGTLKNSDIPWRKILTSRVVWALVFTHTCATWGTYIFLTNIPTYLMEVLKFDIEKNGLLSSLPYVGVWLVIIVSGQLFDFLQSRRYLSTTNARKIANSLGEMGPALLVMGVGFVDCHQAALAVALLTLGVSLCGCQFGAGFILNPGDIGPRYAGILFGISNTFATVPGFLAPISIGIITKHQTQEEWRTVFIICAVIYTAGTIVFVAFGSGELQSWAMQKEEEEGEKEEGKEEEERPEVAPQLKPNQVQPSGPTAH